MRSTNIFALTTFFVTFAFSAFIALMFGTPTISDVPPVATYYQARNFKSGSRNKMGDKIEQFLLQDKRNGYERLDYTDFSDEVSTLSKRASSTFRYSTQSGAMDASDFPRDFRTAWEAHMKAWSDYAEFLKKESKKAEQSEDFHQSSSEYSSDISSTWQEVLSVGREYGANLPAGF
jgi:hypothetical protein